MQPTMVEIYKRINNAELGIHIFKPEGHKIKRPAIVFFFGGGWTGGTPEQFFPQCKYLASRGMIAMSAEYRVKSKHDVTPFECVTDGKSAVRWIRSNAERLGVDPHKLASGGGSAGGHVAACTGTIPDLDEIGEDQSISSVPDAMVLFNPVLVLPLNNNNLAERFKGRNPQDLSPYHHVEPNQPPTIVFHGSDDKIVPINTAEMFERAMNESGNYCRLVSYSGQGHGFFNYGRGQVFYDTMREADKFLVSQGYLAGEATIDQFDLLPD